MRVGLHVPNFTWSDDQGQLGDTFATIARRAERAGFYSLWVMDPLYVTRDGRNNSYTPEAAIKYFRGLAALGIDQALVYMPNVADLEPMDLLATRIIPEVEKMEVAGR